MCLMVGSMFKNGCEVHVENDWYNGIDVSYDKVQCRGFLLVAQPFSPR